MQKIINDPTRFVDEMLEGVLAAHGSELKRVGDERVVVRADAPRAGKVGIVTGGGSGHLPVFLGYVGMGLADGCAVGNVFASPNVDQILAATRAVNGGAGVLYLYGNYSGDVMNFELARELAEEEGVVVETLLAADDVASAPAVHAERRRGIAGMFFLYKVAGALAEGGAALSEVVEGVRRASAGLRSMGVALAPCTLPAAGRPTFVLPPGEMEIGMGLHGEPGTQREALASADTIGGRLTQALVADLPYVEGDRVAVLVNGLGATPREELYILYRAVAAQLARRGIEIGHCWVGNYATSLEMAGASLSMLRLDSELERLVMASAHSPFVTVP